MTKKNARIIWRLIAINLVRTKAETSRCHLPLKERWRKKSTKESNTFCGHQPIFFSIHFYRLQHTFFLNRLQCKQICRCSTKLQLNYVSQFFSLRLHLLSLNSIFYGNFSLVAMNCIAFDWNYEDCNVVSLEIDGKLISRFDIRASELNHC